MTSIKNFKNEQVEPCFMKLIHGSTARKTFESEDFQDSNGCCYNKTTNDAYDDCNNNGIWDEGESGTKTSVICEVEC